MITPDSKLITETEIRERILIIRKNRNIECDKSPNKESILSFTNRQKRIAKLTERESMLINKLKGI